MVCANCGTENAAGRKFCLECAAPLAVTCPACGAANEPIAKFCGQCATPLDAATLSSAATPLVPTPLPPPTEAAVERRLVSVLFADLVGFTPYSEAHDAEEVRETLDRYFEIAHNAIERHGGTIEKFIGDAVMAVWGAPVAKEDDAERAVRAGLELVDAVVPLGVSARAGVLTGEAAVNVGAVGQAMIVGDIVNTAARLQGVATPGTVLVGESTYRAASRAIAFEPAGEQALKGKTAPVPAWRALRIVAERGGRNRTESLEAPFVGRADELRLLKDLFHATERERRIRLVSVMGPAGIGKSRLAREFLNYIDGLVDLVLWHDGRSPAYGEGITFWALGEMVRGRAGLLETDDEPTTRKKVGEVLERFVPDEAERRWIEPALLALLGIQSDARSEELFAAWRTFFERLAAAAPIVMVFEDFHFADTGLLDFVDHLLEWSKGVPIYVVNLSRPELLDKRPDWGAGKRSFVSLFLEPLSQPAMRELIGGLVPGLPEPAVRAIVARADGIPLYAVETVRMLVADGKLALEDGTHRPVGDLTSLAVPETLTALIASRLDGLDPADRSAIADAAVLGQSFTLEALAAVAGRSEAELEPRLQALVRRELLALEADPRSPERGQYVFVQALIREVAYNTVSKRDRKTRHLAAARYFEGLGSDELAGALAGHYVAAHRNAPEGPEADALAAQARIALRAAADRAVALGAHEPAIAFLEQALSVTTDPAEEADLLERAGESAMSAARADDAERLLRRALEIHRRRDDRRAAARTTTLLGRAILIPLRTADAIGLLEPAAVEFDDLGSDPVMVELHAQLARALVLGYDDGTRATPWIDRALDAAERLSLAPVIADTMNTKGLLTAWMAGRTQEGLALIEGAMRLAEGHAPPAAGLRARVNAAVLLGLIDPARGLAVAMEGMVTARRLGLREWLVNLTEEGSLCALRVGNWDWIEQSIDDLLTPELPSHERVYLEYPRVEVLAARGGNPDSELADLGALAAANPDPQWRAHFQQARAAAALAAGRLDEAYEAALAETNADLSAGPVALGVAARAALWAGDRDRAGEAVTALTNLAFRGAATEHLRQTVAAGLAALDGETDKALASYDTALAGWRSLGLRWDEALTGIDMATLLDPGLAVVAAAAESSREILTELRAGPYLERLEAAMARSGAGARTTPDEPLSEEQYRAIRADR